MSPCHNLEPMLVARDSFSASQIIVLLRYAKSTCQFNWRFLLKSERIGAFDVNPLCRHYITSPFPDGVTYVT